ncbi:MAG: transposase [Planctomycetota bacterium]|jgi:REP element-mobilizing transposase RayT|nr:transposase [Planctomycetota bacterium]
MLKTENRHTIGGMYHITNRGLARRFVFETGEDGGRFLELLGKRCSPESLVLHAYCLMPTHFHLLVQTMDGNLAKDMQWVQSIYVRWFNERRKRDGPLFKGRYRAKPIEGAQYLGRVVQYIEQNPVKAGLVEKVEAYELSSARHYRSGVGPTWLCKTLLLDDLGKYWEQEDDCDSPEILPSREDEGAWATACRLLADGPDFDQKGQAREDLLRSVSQGFGDLRDRGGGLKEKMLTVALLKECFNESFSSIGNQLGVHKTTAFRYFMAHGDKLERCQEYREEYLARSQSLQNATI